VGVFTFITTNACINTEGYVCSIDRVQYKFYLHYLKVQACTLLCLVQKNSQNFFLRLYYIDEDAEY